MKIERRRLCEDRLSRLPPNIIETILCLVPIREAARTCILSKQWMYNWTKIPKLVFDEDTFQVSIGGKNNLLLFSLIYQLLLLHQGPIVEFSLSVWTGVEDTSVEVDNIILYLSRMNTVKKLSLGYLPRIPLDVVLSFQQLTDLYLHESCCIHQQLDDDDDDDTFNSGFSSNITTLTILLVRGYMPIQNGIDNFDIIELLEYLPVIENLTIYLWHMLCTRELPRELSTPLYHLKYMYLYDLLLGDGECFYGMPLLALLIRSSPNLEKLKLRTFRLGKPMLDTDSIEDAVVDEEADLSDYYYLFEDIEMNNNLKEMEIVDYCNMKIEMEFVKLMLVKSPVLKTLRIFLDKNVGEDEDLEILKILLSCPRASPLVQIILHRHV
ncbi:F-box/FBD/LRR-repeat protein At1g13570-like [Rutidosis leptorrhynchoides]|uniref:F-box/FBD/LRR-repeat protein At1g13570-like n=1 Tax=Rutidosis leptorrhynchoides TaxID=125765 RepID=UPI003A9942E6